jgi:hypothetical protein
VVITRPADPSGALDRLDADAEADGLSLGVGVGGEEDGEEEGEDGDAVLGSSVPPHEASISTTESVRAPPRRPIRPVSGPPGGGR